MKNEDGILINCWYRLWNKVNRNCSFIKYPEVPMKFEFIENIIKGNNVDTSKYTHLELIGFIDNITKSVTIAKCDWPLITRIVNCVDMCYQDMDNINTTEDVPNTPKEAQNVLLEVLRSILDLSDTIRVHIFGTSEYYNILKLDPDDIITKYNNYIKNTDYRIGDEIYYTTINQDMSMRAWITKIGCYDFDCLLDDGSVKCFPKTCCKKTGLHNLSLSAILHANMEDCIIVEEAPLAEGNIEEDKK